MISIYFCQDNTSILPDHKLPYSLSDRVIAMEKSCTGVIFNIQRFCITDGDGIRTTVFLKGCPLRCKWCHNPESHRVTPQILFKSSRCVGCGACLSVCKSKVHYFEDGIHKLYFDRCTLCGDCTKICCYDALEICGQQVTPEEVYEQIIPDLPYFSETAKMGGVTISGGEPLAQPVFLLKLLRLLKQHDLSVYLETSGYSDKPNLEKITPYVDCFLYDWKLTDRELHKQYTGVSNKQIEANLRFLDSIGKEIILRCPIIPGVNDNRMHFEGIAKLDRELHMIKRVELMAYHTMGEGKKEQIGRYDFFRCTPPNKEEKEAWLSMLHSMGCNAILG